MEYNKEANKFKLADAFDESDIEDETKATTKDVGSSRSIASHGSNDATAIRLSYHEDD